EDYVDEATFLQCCEACHNYGKKWCCPPYDFSVSEYWNRFSQLKLLGRKIIFDQETVKPVYEKAELDEIIGQVLMVEKDKLTLELWAMEEEIPGSISLSAGSCSLCGEGNCSKPLGDKCRNQAKMRYSIESLGGNVGRTCEKLLCEHLEWIEEGKLPGYFVLVGGLLYGNKDND
ncbi:MAG: DUF2284 domain-containing protein, partial [Anaerovoracaceae bacterium]